MDESAQPSVTALDVVVFLDELSLLAVLVITGARTDGPVVVRVVAAVVLPVVAAVVWGLWLAPRARMRLAYPVRLVAKLSVFAVAAGLLAWSGPAVAAIAFLVASAAVITAGEVSDHRRAV